jgi:hypothetical protein
VHPSLDTELREDNQRTESEQKRMTLAEYETDFQNKMLKEVQVF